MQCRQPTTHPTRAPVRAASPLKARGSGAGERVPARWSAQASVAGRRQCARPGDSLHSLATSRSARPRGEANGAVGGDERLFLQGVEGQLLSGEARRGRDAPLLRRALSHGRDQQHLLPDAGRRDARALGGRGARPLRIHAQGAAADHAPEAPQGGRGRRRRVPAARGGPRAEARAAALPASAVLQEGPRGARRFPRAACRRAGRLLSSSATRAGRTRRSTRCCVPGA